MRRPSVAALSADWRQTSCEIAERLASAGWRAWIVGGSVRDLALGRAPTDIDMASAAPPAEVERLFDRTVGVGRAFGTLLVHQRGHEVQLTTFRTEEGHTDQRRPNLVRWGDSLEADAARRDFTCNALYLDPLADELVDPTGGLPDLEARRLRCVGSPAERFREDGLRLLRLARFAANLDFRVEAETLNGARAERTALRGVSAERIAAELRRILEFERSAVAFGLLDELGLLAEFLPQWEQTAPREDLWGVLRELRPVAGFEEGVAVLLGDLPTECAENALESLRLARDEARGVRELWRLEAEGRALRDEPQAARSRWVRWVREPRWRRAARLLEARARATGGADAALERLFERAALVAREELWPRGWIGPQDLAQAGVPRGPRWGELLERAETVQLDGRLRSREEALAWLAAQVAAQSEC